MSLAKNQFAAPNSLRKKKKKKRRVWTWKHSDPRIYILDVFFLMLPCEPDSLAEPCLSSTDLLPAEPCSAYEETGRLECSAQGGPKLLSLSPGTAPKTATWVWGHKPKPFQSLEIRMQKGGGGCVYVRELDHSVVCSLFFSWVLEVLEINLSMIGARLKLLLIIKQHCWMSTRILYCLVFLHK